MDFRVLQSSLPGVTRPVGFVQIRKLYETDGYVRPTSSERVSHLDQQGVWIFGDWDGTLHAAGFDPEKMRERSLWERRENH
jgi:hypothetical protein